MRWENEEAESSKLEGREGGFGPPILKASVDKLENGWNLEKV